MSTPITLKNARITDRRIITRNYIPHRLEITFNHKYVFSILVNDPSYPLANRELGKNAHKKQVIAYNGIIKKWS